MTTENETDFWKDDLLGYEKYGRTFTNLIQTFGDSDGSKVISIEAGFGKGKTFFRKAWANQLRFRGEMVIEIDALQSDNTGDPVVTFLAAMLEMLEPTDQSFWTKALSTSTGLAVGTAKLMASVAARKAGEEAVETIENWLTEDGEKSQIDKILTEFSKQASKTLSAQLTAQLATQKVRETELPKQINQLREKLCSTVKSNRIVILIDELDRCHPEYVISLLEAMKLVFAQNGFIFVLMVNAEHLERIASRRFGTSSKDERYLDKFVDMRLQLPLTNGSLGKAAYSIAKELPLTNPFADIEAFVVPAAAELAQQIASMGHLSMRQLKAVILKVELGLRCNPETPIDVPLLLFLAFNEFLNERGVALSKDLLPRSKLTREYVEDLENKTRKIRYNQRMDGLRENTVASVLTTFGREEAPELIGLPEQCYQPPIVGKDYQRWQYLAFLSKSYIETHQNVLKSVHEISSE